MNTKHLSMNIKITSIHHPINSDDEYVISFKGIDRNTNESIYGQIYLTKEEINKIK